VGVRAIATGETTRGVCKHVIWLILALTAMAIEFDPGRAPLLLLISITSVGLPWRIAWGWARGTALRPALVWILLAIILGAIAQIASMVEPLAGGRPTAGRVIYVAVLALLAALVSVLNARSPGGRVWAGLMVLLVVVFMIPWLEEQTRLRRAARLTQLHLESPWTVFYGLLVVVGLTNYLPTRFGVAAACLAVGFLLEYLGLTQVEWPAPRRATMGCWVSWFAVVSAWVARRSSAREPVARTPSERLWFWFRDHWGVVWALRVLERFNRSAELARWSIRLSWFGFEPADSLAPDPPPAAPDEAEAVLRSLVRRFALPWRLDQASGRTFP
jgi:hypothetical protein